MKQELKDKMNDAANNVLCATEGKYKMATRAAKAVSAAVRVMCSYDIGSVQGFDLPENEGVVYGDGEAINLVEQLAGRYNQLRMKNSELMAEKDAALRRVKKLTDAVEKQDAELEALRKQGDMLTLSREVAKDIAEIKAALRQDKVQPEPSEPTPHKYEWRITSEPGVLYVEEWRGSRWDRMCFVTGHLSADVMEAVARHHNKAVAAQRKGFRFETWAAKRYTSNPGRGISIWATRSDQHYEALVVQTCVDKENEAAMHATAVLCELHNACEEGRRT